MCSTLLIVENVCKFWPQGQHDILLGLGADFPYRWSDTNFIAYNV